MMDRFAAEVQVKSMTGSKLLWIFGVESGNEVMLVRESLKVCLRVTESLIRCQSLDPRIFVLFLIYGS